MISPKGLPFTRLSCCWLIFFGAGYAMRVPQWQTTWANSCPSWQGKQVQRFLGIRLFFLGGGWGWHHGSTPRVDACHRNRIIPNPNRVIKMKLEKITLTTLYNEKSAPTTHFHGPYNSYKWRYTWVTGCYNPTSRDYRILISLRMRALLPGLTCWA